MLIPKKYLYENRLHWMHPFAYAETIDNFYSEYVFLHSSKTDEKNRFSIIAFGVINKIQSKKELDTLQDSDEDYFLFGYIGYEVNESEICKSYKRKPSFINTQDVFLWEFENLLLFDHIKKTVTLLSVAPGYFNEFKNLFKSKNAKFPSGNIPEPISLQSNMTNDYYLNAIERTVNAITEGMFCQANITRSFFGYAETVFDPLFLFYTLSCKNPVPYGSLIKTKEYSSVSSSPEMFVTIDRDHVLCNLIKGSATRYADPQKDLQSKEDLKNCQKNIAENLMVIDLMRNDLAINSIPGSVAVPVMFDLQSYEGVHHLVSSVTSTKLKECSSIKFIYDCFPPGSITGTPKTEVMRWCSSIEKTRRNIYCGTIGILGNNYSKLSVAIRTVILKDNMFEFHAGGGITCLSDPQEEHKEVLIKIKKIATCMGLEKEIADYFGIHK